MKAPLGRKAVKDVKPVRIKYTGSNGLEVLEWSRDDNTTARFQWRPQIAPEDVRVFLVHPHPHWEIVPIGATLVLDVDGNLELVLPEEAALSDPEEKRD